VQAGRGLYACYGRPAGVADVTPCNAAADSLIERALTNGDEHVVKFTEACLARHRIAPSPVYPAAIIDAFGRSSRGELRRDRRHA
jgi:hypothetical protein